LHANFGVCLHIISWLKALLLESFFVVQVLLEVVVGFED
jgi:hypothetical protein